MAPPSTGPPCNQALRQSRCPIYRSAQRWSLWTGPHLRYELIGPRELQAHRHGACNGHRRHHHRLTTGAGAGRSCRRFRRHSRWKGNGGVAVPNRSRPFRTLEQRAGPAAQDGGRLGGASQEGSVGKADGRLAKGRQAVLQARRWLPNRRLIVVADAGFSGVSLIAALRRHAGRGRWAARG